MKKITDSCIKKHLKSAVNQICPEISEQIWDQPVKKASGDEWYLEGTGCRKRSDRKVIKMFSAAAACAALCLCSYYMIGLRTDATIYLDVNPGIELQINRMERVLLAEAGNADGEVILKNMELKNTELDVAVNAIIGSMVRNGYLKEEGNRVLLSVDCSSSKRAAGLRAKLSDEVYGCLEEMVGAGKVLEQEVEVDEELEKLAEQYQITPGKAALLKKVTAENPGLDYSELVLLGMDELHFYLENLGINLDDYADHTEAFENICEETDDEEKEEKEERETDIGSEEEHGREQEEGSDEEVSDEEVRENISKDSEYSPEEEPEENSGEEEAEEEDPETVDCDSEEGDESEEEFSEEFETE